MSMPYDFQGYPCEDYFNSAEFIKGHWDESAQLWFTEPADKVAERPELDFLVIGRPGCDGIEFGYRRNASGLWAYRPIERKFTFIAPDVAALLSGWYSGEVRL
jgi:hypothetical protein